MGREFCLFYLLSGQILCPDTRINGGDKMADEQSRTGVGESRSDFLSAEEVKEVDLAFTRSDYKPLKGMAMKSQKKVVNWGRGEVEAMPNDFIPAKAEKQPEGVVCMYSCCGKEFGNMKAFNMHRRMNKKCPHRGKELKNKPVPDTFTLGVDSECLNRQGAI